MLLLRHSDTFVAYKVERFECQEAIRDQIRGSSKSNKDKRSIRTKKSSLFLQKSINATPFTIQSKMKSYQPKSTGAGKQ